MLTETQREIRTLKVNINDLSDRIQQLEQAKRELLMKISLLKDSFDEFDRMRVALRS
jgi:predicted  nucleic acid-binding Zn-ribbon protein